MVQMMKKNRKMNSVFRRFISILFILGIWSMIFRYDCLALDTADVTNKFHKQDWFLILVNKQHPIPQDYEFSLGKLNNGMRCDKRIVYKMNEMLNAAEKENISLMVRSPYRNEGRQTQLFSKKVTQYMKKGDTFLNAYKNTAQAVTLPGASEHQLGLAFDLISKDYSMLEEGFADTQTGKWLQENSYKYGFILRYPKGKEDITGIEYEPWHFRYVGSICAEYMYQNDLTLEEFVQMLSEGTK